MRLIDILESLDSDYEIHNAELKVSQNYREESWLQQEVRGVSLNHADIEDGWIFVALGSSQPKSNDGNKPKRHGLDYLSKPNSLKSLAVFVDSKDSYAMAYLRSAKNQNHQSTLDKPSAVSKITPEAGFLKIIKVDGLADNLDKLAKAVYDHEDLPFIGVTGTNGKSSVVHTLSHVLAKMHKKTAVIGTVYTGFAPTTDEVPNQSSGLTTPDIFSLYRYARDFQTADADYLALECSSHGLKQNRIKGLKIICGVFTNISQDHMDYHSSYEDYEMSKHKLFEISSLKYVVINKSDPIGKKWLDEMKNEHAQDNKSSKHLQCLSYGYDEDGKDVDNKWHADIFADQIKITEDGAQAMVHSRFGTGMLKTKTPANWGIYNSLAVLGVMLHLGFDFAKCLTALSCVPPLSGRMQKLSKLAAAGKSYADFIVDYAHSTDALRSTLTSARSLVRNQGILWVVFGCGGERDKDKRAPMGKLASQLADKIVLTSDNPRGEDPDEIIQDILKGISAEFQQSSIALDEHRDDHISVIPDRAEAIDFALDNAKLDDLVVVAGKGHESYQDKGGVKTYFNDYEYIKERLR